MLWQLQDSHSVNVTSFVIIVERATPPPPPGRRYNLFGDYLPVGWICISFVIRRPCDLPRNPTISSIQLSSNNSSRLSTIVQLSLVAQSVSESPSRGQDESKSLVHAPGGSHLKMGSTTAHVLQASVTYLNKMFYDT